jgi:hypothetical protein
LARERFNLLSALLQSRRLVEWSIIAAVLISLVWTLEHEARVVRGQGEKVAVRSTLNALRASLVIDQLLGQVRGTSAPKNPFTLLQQLPANYGGELAMRDIYSVSPGSWVFDPECGCVGYRLLYPQWLEPAQEADTLWFRVATRTGDASLVPLAEYRWFGQRTH